MKKKIIIIIIIISRLEIVLIASFGYTTETKQKLSKADFNISC